jgi:TolB-like protein/tetratricopeptide (TPR) repeat protein
MSSDTEQEFFSDGLSEELLNLLARIPELRVTSRSSAFAFKGKEIEIPEIARKLNVAHVLEGSVRKSGERVRITAQLIDTRSDTHLWSQTWDRTLEDIFAVQDEIAAAVAAQMKITLLGQTPRTRAVDPRAYSLYLQGREMLRRNTADGMQAAMGLFQQALEIDPRYAAAMAGLANVYTGQVAVGLRPIAEGEALARETAEKALALDPDSADAELSLARIAMSNQMDFAAAALHLQRALQLDPNKIDALALAATLAKNLGRLDATMALVQLALERDPVSSSLHNNVGLNYIAAGRLDEAIAEFRTALALSPGRIGTQYNIAEALLHKGDAAAALEALQLESAEVWRLIGTAMTYHTLGRRADSDAALAQLVTAGEASWSYNIAFVYAWRGEPDMAFEWLDKAARYKDPGLSEIAGERLFSSLHEDPRWLPFLRGIGMAPEQLAMVQFEVSLPGQDR